MNDWAGFYFMIIAGGFVFCILALICDAIDRRINRR